MTAGERNILDILFDCMTIVIMYKLLLTTIIQFKTLLIDLRLLFNFI